MFLVSFSIVHDYFIIKLTAHVVHTRLGLLCASVGLSCSFPCVNLPISTKENTSYFSTQCSLISIALVCYTKSGIGTRAAKWPLALSTGNIGVDYPPHPPGTLATDAGVRVSVSRRAVPRAASAVGPFLKKKNIFLFGPR